MANKTSFNSGRTLDAATENIEILTGARGNKLDKAITLRELGELGLANLVKVGSSYKASASTSSSDSNASSNIEWPSSPENVAASGAFNVILVQWDQPRYKGHQYAEIWRAEEDNLSKAVWIGATAAVIYPDPIGGDAKAYYWVRFVNSNGDKGAFNSQSGIYAETSVDVAQILEALTHQISADQLTQDLLTPIQQASGFATTISNLQKTVSDNQTSTAVSISAINASVGSTSIPYIVSSQGGYQSGSSYVKDGAGNTLFTGGRSFNVVVLDSSTGAVSAKKTYDVWGSASIGDQMAAYLDSLPVGTRAIVFTHDEPCVNFTSSALKTALVRFGASLANLNAINTSLQWVSYVLGGVAGAGDGGGQEFFDPTRSSRTTKTITFSFGGLGAALEVTNKVIADLKAATYSQWSVKTTVGALTGGVGFINDGTKTRFTVAAQQFAIVDSTLGENKFVPFVVSGGKVVMANAFIDTAYIQSLASAQITAEKINSLNLTSVNISGGTLTLGSGNNIMMANGGALGIGKGGANSGWGYSWHTIIYADGSIYTDRLYASNGTFTGTVNANAGTFNNVTIEESCDVKGTIYADKIVGDVVAVRILTIGTTYSLIPSAKARTLLLQFTFSNNSSDTVAGIRIVINGSPITLGTLSMGTTRNFFVAYSIPANSAYNFYLTNQYTSSVSLAGTVIITPESGGTFY